MPDLCSSPDRDEREHARTGQGVWVESLRFDHLTKTVVAAAPRRRRKKPHHHRKHTGNRAGQRKNKNKKQKDKQTCQAESPAQTCADRCGEAVNNCNEPVDCGSCACDSPCGACHACNEETGECEPDSTQVGVECGGEPGQVCQTNGECACDAGSCDFAQCLTCGPGQTCVQEMDNTPCDEPGQVCCGGGCINTDRDLFNCGSCGHNCTVLGANDCEEGVCCQTFLGEFAFCSIEVPCCHGFPCRTSGPLSGTCCLPSGTATCFTTTSDQCCSNTCIPNDATCTGHCPGTCA